MQLFRRTIITTLFLIASFVLAHADFESSNPEDGAFMQVAPLIVKLVFDEDVDTKFSVFKVYKLENEALIADLRAKKMDHGHDENHGEDHHGEDGHGDEHSESHDETDDHHADEHTEEASELDVFVEDIMAMREDSNARVDTGLMSEERMMSEVVLLLDEALEPGYYLVMWRALSDDTHIEAGYIHFEYAPE